MDTGMGPVFAFCETAMHCTLIVFYIEAGSASTDRPHYKPVLGDNLVAVENRRLVAAAVKAGFTVNLSADNPAHADRLAEVGIAPVVTVLARAYARRAIRHRFKRRRDEWTETISEWRDGTVSLPRYTPA